jgi:TonB family protein
MPRRFSMIVGLFGAAALAGCNTVGSIELRPIANAMPPAAEGTFELNDVQVQPAPVYQSPPHYPFELRRAGAQGQCTVLFTVRTDGTVTDALALQASDERFATAAIDAVLRWRFRPAQWRGGAVDCRITLPIVFTVNQ